MDAVNQARAKKGLEPHTWTPRPGDKVIVATRTSQQMTDYVSRQHELKEGDVEPGGARFVLGGSPFIMSAESEERDVALFDGRPIDGMEMMVFQAGSARHMLALAEKEMVDAQDEFRAKAKEMGEESSPFVNHQQLSDLRHLMDRCQQAIERRQRAIESLHQDDHCS